MAVSELKQLLVILQKTRQQLNDVVDMEEAKDALDEIIAHAQEPISIMVMGEFSTGKSTFINSLVGQKVAAMNATPTTAVITKLCYGEADRITVYFRDSRSQVYQAEDFAKLTAETEDKNIGDMHKDIDYVERQLPLDILKWVTIIDSPGLNALKKEHSEATQRFVKQADTVIWMYAADQTATRNEIAAMENLSSRLQPIAIINKMDMLDEEEDDPEEFLNGVKRQLDGKAQAVIGLSARLALEGKLENNQAKLEESNLNELDQVMRTLVVPNREQYKMNSLMDEMGKYCFAAFWELNKQNVAIQEYEKIDYTTYMQKREAILPTEEILSEMGVALKNLIEPYAVQKNAQALFLIATLKYWGVGAFENKEEAMKLLEDAAVKNNVAAQEWLVGLYQNQREWARAMHWNIRLAKQGDIDAQSRVAWEYYTGKNISQDYEQAVKWFTKLAEQDVAEAQYMLARCYEEGNGITYNLEKAFEYYYKAADCGHAAAQNNLGDYYCNGEVVEIDEKEAVRWYAQAAEQGDDWGQFNFGDCYYLGYGVSKDYKEAVYWYTKAAEQENACGQKGLGDCYYYGKGVSQDYSKAMHWYEKAAEQNNKEACCQLGECYYTQATVNAYKQSIYWYEKAIEQGNAGVQTALAKAQYQLGMCYYKGKDIEKDYDKAVDLFSEAAEQGNADAQSKLAICYMEGHGVSRDDSKAIYWAKKAVEQGHSNGQAILGTGYLTGEGVPQEHEKAVYWFTKSAEQGDADGQVGLGLCYREGTGVLQDYEKAVYWLKKSAEQGNDGGQLFLGDCYHRGIGVLQDQKKAVELFLKSAQQDNASAQYMLGICYSNGTGVSQDYTKAVYWYTKSAEQEDADGQFAVSLCYYHGDGVEQDYAEAFYWSAKAAEQGHGDAQSMIGCLYEDGLGTTQDMEKAVYWHGKAVEQGVAKGQANLGMAYALGFGGLEKDEAKALELFKLAADQDEEAGQFGLGMCYLDGIGISKDYSKAIYWLEKSAAQGYPIAEKKLASIRGQSKNFASFVSGDTSLQTNCKEVNIKEAVEKIKRRTSFGKKISLGGLVLGGIVSFMSGSTGFGVFWVSINILIISVVIDKFAETIASLNTKLKKW